MKLDDILDSLKIDNPTNEKPITHTLMDGGKLHVPKNKLNSLYKKIVKHGIEKEQNVQLVERMGEYAVAKTSDSGCIGRCWYGSGII